MFLILVLVLPQILNASFLDKHLLSELTREDQQEYLEEYLADLVQTITTPRGTSTSFFQTARDLYPRGLKQKFLDEIEDHVADLMRGSGVDEAMSYQSVIDAMVRFQECTKLDDGFIIDDDEIDGSSTRRSRHKRQKRHVSASPLIKCVEEAEVDLIDAVSRWSMDRMNNGNDRDQRNQRKVERFYGRLSNLIIQIQDVTHNLVWRWPWLTDEGWTWKWVIGFAFVALLTVAIILSIVYFIYTYFFKTSDGWGDDVEEEEEDV